MLMMPKKPSPSPSFVGLHDDVVYRLELGFAIVDDGKKLFRMPRALFEQLLTDGHADQPVTAGAETLALVEKHGTVFSLLNDGEAARQSLLEKEI